MLRWAWAFAVDAVLALVFAFVVASLLVADLGFRYLALSFAVFLALAVALMESAQVREGKPATLRNRHGQTLDEEDAA